MPYKLKNGIYAVRCRYPRCTFNVQMEIEQNLAGAKPEEIDASGADALHVQRIIEAIIMSWETGTVVTL